MSCYSPNRVHVDYDSNGDRVILWKGQNKGLQRIGLPCSRCVGCKLDYAAQWTGRCMMESQMHEDNCFITLTFDDKYLPHNRSLDKRTWQLFNKRLRKFAGVRYSFYAAGEYGSVLGRPHYHALIFGFDFKDKVLHTVRNGHRLYRSASLEKLWPFGFSSIGDVTVESASYVARYCLKKVPVKGSEDHYVDKVTGEVLQSEFVLMSRRPPIAFTWFEKFGFTDVFPLDELVVNGRKTKPPRFFDRKLEELNPQMYDAVKAVRLSACPPWEDNTDERLLTKEKVKLAQIKSLKRSLGG